jgi:hypothetical protein
MHRPKARWLGMLAALGAAITIFATPISASSATLSTTATAHVSSSQVIPQEKTTWIYSEYNFPLNQGAACEAKGRQLVADGWGFNYACEHDNPVKNRLGLWIEAYI